MLPTTAALVALTTLIFLANFNIDCADLANAKDVKLDSKDFHGELYTTGRLAYGKVGETPLNIKAKNLLVAQII